MCIYTSRIITRLKFNKHLLVSEDQTKEMIESCSSSKPIRYEPQCVCYSCVTEIGQNKSPMKRVVNLWKIPILPNGDLKAIQVFGKKYVLQNSCSFDALIQILTVCYVDSSTFGKWVMKNGDDKSIWKIVNSLFYRGSGLITQKIRLEFFLKHDIMNIKIKKTFENVYAVDVKSTVSNMIRHMFGPNYLTFYKYVTCTNCGKVNKIEFNNIIDMIISEKDITALNQIIQKLYPGIYMCTTKGCHQILTLNEPVHRGPIIFLDLMNKVNLDKMHFTDIECPLNICLEKIPRYIIIDSQTFKLQGCIRFTTDKSNLKLNTVGHYTALCTSDFNRWEMFDGLKKSAKMVNKSKYPISVQTLVYLKYFKNDISLLWSR